jgi:hypothetical protein
MPRSDRETRAVAEIECPRCHARPGKPCFVRGEPGRSVHGPACHTERRTANQERRRALGLAGPVEMPPGTPNGPPRKSGHFADVKDRGPMSRIAENEFGSFFAARAKNLLQWGRDPGNNDTMTTIHLTIERDRESRSSRDGARFRVKCYAQPGGPALLISTRACQSVTRAKSEASAIFGQLDWSDSTVGDVRCTAVLEIEE